jgi:hypothetical protein
MFSYLFVVVSQQCNKRTNQPKNNQLTEW